MIVYNKEYEEIYRRMSADRYVTAVDLSIDGSRLVCSDVLSENGSYNSLITVTDMRSGETLYQTSVSDELVLRTGFSDDGKSIYVITDSMLHFYSSELESVTDFKYNQSKTEKFFIENGVIVLTESNNLSGNSMTLIGFDFAGNQLFRENADSKITSVAVGKNELYALSSKYLYSYGFDENKSLTLRKKIATDGRFSTVLADSTGRCITASTKKAVRGILDSDNSDSGENGDENTNSSEKKVRNENFDNR